MEIRKAISVYVANPEGGKALKIGGLSHTSISEFRKYVIESPALSRHELKPWDPRDKAVWAEHNNPNHQENLLMAFMRKCHGVKQLLVRERGAIAQKAKSEADRAEKLEHDIAAIDRKLAQLKLNLQKTCESMNNDTDVRYFSARSSIDALRLRTSLISGEIREQANFVSGEKESGEIARVAENILRSAGVSIPIEHVTGENFTRSIFSSDTYDFQRIVMDICAKLPNQAKTDWPSPILHKLLPENGLPVAWLNQLESGSLPGEKIGEAQVREIRKHMETARARQKKLVDCTAINKKSLAKLEKMQRTMGNELKVGKLIAEGITVELKGQSGGLPPEIAGLDSLLRKIGGSAEGSLGTIIKASEHEYGLFAESLSCLRESIRITQDLAVFGGSYLDGLASYLSNSAKISDSEKRRSDLLAQQQRLLDVTRKRHSALQAKIDSIEKSETLAHNELRTIRRRRKGAELHRFCSPKTDTRQKSVPEQVVPQPEKKQPFFVPPLLEKPDLAAQLEAKRGEKVVEFVEKAKVFFKDFLSCNPMVVSNFEQALAALAELYVSGNGVLRREAIKEKFAGRTNSETAARYNIRRNLVRISLTSDSHFRIMVDIADPRSPFICFAGNKRDSDFFLDNKQSFNGAYSRAERTGQSEMFKMLDALIQPQLQNGPASPVNGKNSSH